MFFRTAPEYISLHISNYRFFIHPKKREKVINGISPVLVCDSIRGLPSWAVGTLFKACEKICFQLDFMEEEDEKSYK